MPKIVKEMLKYWNILSLSSFFKSMISACQTAFHEFECKQRKRYVNTKTRPSSNRKFNRIITVLWQIKSK